MGQFKSRRKLLVSTLGGVDVTTESSDGISNYLTDFSRHLHTPLYRRRQYRLSSRRIKEDKIYVSRSYKNGDGQWPRRRESCWDAAVDSISEPYGVAFRLALPWLDNSGYSTSDKESQTALAAHRIDDYYRGGFRHSGRDTVYFLVHLYYLILNVTKFLPCDGPLQGILVQLAVELQKLPEMWCTMNDVRYPPSPQRPVVILILTGNHRTSLTSIRCTAPLRRSWMTSVDRPAVGSRAVILLLHLPANPRHSNECSRQKSTT